MADEVTYSGVSTQLAYAAEVARENVISAWYSANNVGDMLRMKDISGFPSDSALFPKPPRLAAQGVGDAVEIPNSPYVVDSATIAVGRVGIVVEPTDLGLMGSIADLDWYGQQLGEAVAEKFVTDVTGLASGFATQVGATTVNLSEQNLMDVTTTLRASRVRGPFKGVLHPQQWNDAGAGVGATITPAGAQGTGAVPLTNLFGNADDDPGMLYGVDWKINETVATATAGADRLGMVVNSSRALGNVTKRGVQVSLDTNRRKGTTEIVVDIYYGVGEISDLDGVGVLSDA